MTSSRSSLTRDQARDIDRRAESDYGLPGLVLMENAGRGSAEVLVSLGVHGPVVVMAGKGNNGGDGYVIARHLENAGCDVTLVTVVDPTILAGDAEMNHRVWVCGGGRVVHWSERDEVERLLGTADWIVDALLGTGARGLVRPPVADAIETINRSEARVLAIDLPSGLDCDSGEPLGTCVRADQTVTFVALKRGLLSEAAQGFCGEIQVVSIGIPRSLREDVLG